MGPIGLRAILTIEAANRSNLSIVSLCMLESFDQMRKIWPSYARLDMLCSSKATYGTLRGHSKVILYDTKFCGRKFGEFGESTLIHQNILVQFQLTIYRECSMTKVFTKIKFLS